MRKILSIVIFLTFPALVFAQEWQYGLIMPEQTGQEGVCCVYAPKSGFTVYNRPGGSKIGTLTRYPDPDRDYESYYQIYFVYAETGKASEITLDRFEEVGYKVWAITFFERRNGFVRIMDANTNY